MDFSEYKDEMMKVEKYCLEKEKIGKKLVTTGNNYYGETPNANRTLSSCSLRLPSTGKS